METKITIPVIGIPFSGKKNILIEINKLFPGFLDCKSVEIDTAYNLNHDVVLNRFFYGDLKVSFFTITGNQMPNASKFKIKNSTKCVFLIYPDIDKVNLQKKLFKELEEFSIDWWIIINNIEKYPDFDYKSITCKPIDEGNIFKVSPHEKTYGEKLSNFIISIITSK